MPDSSRPDFNDAAVKERLDKLQRAARYGELDVLRTLEKDDPLLNYQPSYDRTLLAHAIASTELDAAQLLRKLGATIGNTNSADLLRDALRHRNEALAEFMLQEGIISISAATADHRLLSAAIEGGCINMARRLLEAGANPDSGDRYDDTPLVKAARYEKVAFVELLLAHGADPNKTNGVAKTGLHYAAGDGNIDLMKLLMKNGARHDIAASDGKTALNEAVDGNHAAAVRLLLEAGAKPDGTGQNPSLTSAAAKGNSTIVELLLSRGADPNGGVQSGRKDVPLVEAAQQGDDRTICALLDAGADVNLVPTGLRKPALVSAAYSSASVDVIKKMLAKGAKVDTADYYGRTALLRVCEDGQAQKAAVLVAAGADVNKADDNGYTPLYYAAYRGDENLVRLLLENGALPDGGGNKSRETPLYAACERGHQGVVRLLLSHKADVEKADGSMKRTPVLVAARARHAAIVESLIAAGANLECRDYTGKTALFTAIEACEPSIAAILMDAGASVAVMNNSGVSLLTTAIAANDVASLRRLLAVGLSPDMADFDGRLPLVLAAENGNIEALRLLMGAGATLDLQDARGQTAVIASVRGSGDEVPRALLAVGASLDLYDRYGKTALAYAEEYSWRNEIEKVIRAEVERRRIVAEKNADPAERIRVRVEELEKILSQGDKAARAVFTGDPEQYRAVKDDQFWLDERRHPSWNLVQFALLTENRQMLRLLAVWHGECEPEHLEDLRTLTGNKYPVYARLLRQSGFAVSAADLALKPEEKVKLLYAKSAAAANVKVALVQEADGRSKTVLYTSVSPYNTASREDVWGGLKSAFRDLGKRVTVEDLKTFKPKEQKADAAPRRASGMSGPRP